MKQIFENKIINIDENIFDNKFLFKIPINLSSPLEVDIADLLKEYKNQDLNYKKDYKLWSEVYSPKDELEIFTTIFEDALKNNKKVHISNCSLAEEIEMVKALYQELGYFNEELNCFIVDFENAPVTIGVNINNIIYSFKDYKSMREKALFIPPPREPRHQKTLKTGLNAGIISTITLNDINTEIIHLNEMLTEEKTNFIKLAKNLYYNFKKRGFSFEESEIILEIQ